MFTKQFRNLSFLTEEFVDDDSRNLSICLDGNQWQEAC